MWINFPYIYVRSGMYKLVRVWRHSLWKSLGCRLSNYERRHWVMQKRRPMCVSKWRSNGIRIPSIKLKGLLLWWLLHDIYYTRMRRWYVLRVLWGRWMWWRTSKVEMNDLSELVKLLIITIKMNQELDFFILILSPWHIPPSTTTYAIIMRASTENIILYNI